MVRNKDVGIVENGVEGNWKTRRWTRRQFLGEVGAGVLVLAIGAGGIRLRAEPNGTRRVAIAFTTDLHGNVLPTEDYQGTPDLGGFARCATQIRSWRDTDPEMLVVDVGDLYQGTEVGLRTGGLIMPRCLNALNYDTWVPGNHEFDWGADFFVRAVEASAMPLVCANVRLSEKLRLQDGRGVRPWVIRKSGGVQVGFVGVTTPGMPFWLRPEYLAGFEVTDPVVCLQREVRECRAAGAELIVLCAHMGTRDRGDDFANRLEEISRSVPGIDLCLGGHTHRRVIGSLAGGTPYGQANYFGIDCGRVVIEWDPERRQVRDCAIDLVRMDGGVAQDPGVLSLCAEDLRASAVALAAPAGILPRAVSVRSGPGSPSEVEELIADAIRDALAARGVRCEGVFHGLFDSEHPIPAGPKTVADWWKVIPFENEVVTGDLTPEQIRAVLTENFESGQGRNLMGMQVRVEAVDGRRAKLVDVLDAQGRPLERSKRYRIAFNSYDGQSGGQRLSRLASILREPGVNNTLHPVQTREALITWASKK